MKHQTVALLMMAGVEEKMNPNFHPLSRMVKGG